MERLQRPLQWVTIGPVDVQAPPNPRFVGRSGLFVGLPEEEGDRRDVERFTHPVRVPTGQVDGDHIEVERTQRLQLFGPLVGVRRQVVAKNLCRGRLVAVVSGVAGLSGDLDGSVMPREGQHGASPRPPASR